MVGFMCVEDESATGLHDYFHIRFSRRNCENLSCLSFKKDHRAFVSILFYMHMNEVWWCWQHEIKPCLLDAVIGLFCCQDAKKQTWRHFVQICDSWYLRLNSSVLHRVATQTSVGGGYTTTPASIWLVWVGNTQPETQTGVSGGYTNICSSHPLSHRLRYEHEEMEGFMKENKISKASQVICWFSMMYIILCVSSTYALIYVILYTEAPECVSCGLITRGCHWSDSCISQASAWLANMLMYKIHDGGLLLTQDWERNKKESPRLSRMCSMSMCMCGMMQTEKANVCYFVYI